MIFLGDNGTPGALALAPFSAQHGKATMYDWRGRRSAIIAGPAVEAPGSVSPALVHLSDVYATVAELAQVDLPSVLPLGTEPRLE